MNLFEYYGGKDSGLQVSRPRRNRLDASTTPNPVATGPEAPTSPNNNPPRNGQGYNGSTPPNSPNPNNAPPPQPTAAFENGENDEDHPRGRHFGMLRSLRWALSQYDKKEVKRLLATPQAHPDVVEREFQRAFKIALKRKTADGMRRTLEIYDEVIKDGATYLRDELSALAERTRTKLDKVQAKHSKLLAQWQKKYPRSRNYVRELDIRNEKVVDVYYRHKIHIVMLSVLPIILFVINAGLFFLFNAVAPGLTGLNLIILLLNLVWFWWSYNDWSNDYLMITNRRVLQCEKLTLFKEDKKSLLIERVEQVKYEANRGLMEFAFRIGTVTISGAGKIELKFNRVYLPDRIRKEINDAKMKYMGGRKDFRSKRMENKLRNKLVGDKLENWDDEEIQIDAVPRSELGFWQAIVPFDPVDEGNNQVSFRRHPIFLYKDWVTAGLVYLVLILGGIPLLTLLFGFNNPIITGVSATIIGVILVWNSIMVWYRWEDWYNDRYTLNGIKEIMDVEKKPFGLDEEKSVIALSKVQDLELSQPSVFSNFFNYGNITVTTAGQGQPIVFRSVPKPEDVRREISRRMETAKNLAEDMGDDLTLSYFAHYSKIFQETQKSMQEQILDEVRKIVHERPPQP